MEKIIILIQREYLQRVRTRWFLISTIATPLLLVGISMLPYFAARTGGGAARQVIVLDQSGDPALFQTIKDKSQSDRLALTGTTAQFDPAVADMVITKFELSHIVVAPDQDIDQVRKTQNAEIEKDSRRAYIILRAGILEGSEPEYYGKNVSDLSIRQLGYSIGMAIAERRLVRAGLDTSKASQYLNLPEMKIVKLAAEGERREGGQTVLIALIMFFSIFMSIYLYGHSVMQGIVEEKQSRIAEVMLSTVRPFSMMIAKIIGIGLVGLTQYAIWVISLILLTTFGVSLLGRGVLQLQILSNSMWLIFIIYFILGYFLFATLYAMIGSIVSRPEDGHQLQYIVSALIAIPSMWFWMVMRDPNGTQTVVLSLIPFFAPTLMALRMAVVEPPLWQIGLSILLLVITIFGGIWIAAKIHRVGILMYGKRPSLAEV
ncbi:MAG: ABC transporter permease, partial [Acidobacteriota bacterium]